MTAIAASNEASSARLLAHRGWPGACFVRAHGPCYLTKDLASSFDSAMSSAGLRFTIDCPKLPERVHVDPALWEKVILNLLVVEDDDDRLLAVAWEFCGPTSRARSQP